RRRFRRLSAVIPDASRRAAKTIVQVGDLSMRERWPLSIVGEGLRPARLAPPQVWAELPLKRCHAQAVRAAMLLRLRQEPPTGAERSLRDRAERFTTRYPSRQVRCWR